MRIISSDDIEGALAYPELIETLLRAYRSHTVVPQPARFTIERPKAAAGTLSALPAWTNFAAQGHTDRGYIGCGLSLDLPQTDAQTGSSVSHLASALYLLFSGASGHPIALLDGMRLSAWRKCSMHALAARYLAREDASRLLVLGANPMLVRLIEAYATVRNIRSVLLMAGAEASQTKLASEPELNGITFGTTDNLAGAVEGADIICFASSAVSELSGIELSPGVHIDVFDPACQLDPGLVSHTRVFVGDRNDADALAEEEIAADLHELARGEKAGRRFYGQITLFQTGEASGLADIAVAGHVFLRS